jgi:hypothetical protein
MGLNLEDDSAIKRYLLGELTEEDQQTLEERLLTDNGYFERLQMLEDELVDDYARGSLTAGEREKFDSFFLCTPERYQKLRFASALERYVSTAAVANQSKPVDTGPRAMSSWQLLKLSLFGRNPILGYSLAAALLLIVLGGAWSIDRYWRDQLEEIEAQHRTTEEELQRRLGEQRAVSGQLAEELERERSQRPSQIQPVSPATLSLVLTPGLPRDSSSITTATAPAGTSLIRLELPTEGDDYKSYRATLHNNSHAEILIQNMLKARTTAGNTVVVVNVPTETISPGGYYVKLYGITSAGDTENLRTYHFRVKPQAR